MPPTQQELRRYYRSLSDEALTHAHQQGPSGYTPEAWSVLAAEMTDRGLPTDPTENRAPAPTGPPLRDGEAMTVADRMLRADVPVPDNMNHLLERGLDASQVQAVLEPLLLSWRASGDRVASGAPSDLRFSVSAIRQAMTQRATR